MKPLKLKMRAFGPYLNQTEIDFEKGLGGNNFFLIHGATGAGKTTILDAICYALYNKCSGIERNGEMMRSQKAGGDNKTEIDFTFTLNGKIYRVIRSPKYKRKRLRGEGEVEEKSAVTIYEDGKVIDREKTDVFFNNLLHLDANQFRQVVMLPQGEFRKFLMAGSGEREKILKVIFNSYLYENIETKLKDNAADSKFIFDNLKTQLKNLLDDAKSIGKVDDDNFNEDSVYVLIKNFSDKLEQLDAEISRLKKIYDKAAANLAEGKKLHAAFEHFDDSAAKLQSLKKNLEVVTKNFDAAQVEYNRRKAEEPRRLDLETKINELKKIQAAVKDLQAAQSKLADAEKSERDAKSVLEKLESDKIKYESLLKELKDVVEKFKGSDVKLKAAEQKLIDAQNKKANLTNLERLKNELTAANRRLAVANKNFDATQTELNRLRTLQKIGAAAKLAEGLKDGEPCPVCGSTVHPKIAVSKEIIPTDEEIAYVEKILQRHQKEKDLAVNAVGKITGNIETLADALTKSADVLTVEDAKKIYDSAKLYADKLEKSRERLKNGEKLTEKLYADLDKQRLIGDKAVKAAENLRGIVAEKISQIPADYLKAVEKISIDLKKIQSEKQNLDDAFNVADKNFRKSSDEKSKLEGAVKTAEDVHKDAAAKVEGKVKPNLDDLQFKVDDAQKVHIEQIKLAKGVEETLNSLKKITYRLKSVTADIESAEENFVMWKSLSDTANGKLSFQRYYLNSMFRQVIEAANMRLEKMSGGRYQFRNKEQTNKAKLAGLDLEIFDSYASTCREVATLSGGESFLAALSLALGLAAVVKNTSGGINLDTIFIDEGFGSLDSETLDYALNTLVNLQADGRLVGIISHVEELKQRIPTRLEVVKQKDGSFARFNN